MDFEILEDIENKLLERREIKALIHHEGVPVPKREEVLAKLAAHLNKEREQVVLIKLQAKYGIGQSIAHIHVYNDPKRAKAIEKEHLLKRSGIIKEESQ